MCCEMLQARHTSSYVNMNQHLIHQACLNFLWLFSYTQEYICCFNPTAFLSFCASASPQGSSWTWLQHWILNPFVVNLLYYWTYWTLLWQRCKVSNNAKCCTSFKDYTVVSKFAIVIHEMAFHWGQRQWTEWWHLSIDCTAYWSRLRCCFSAWESHIWWRAVSCFCSAPPSE